MGTGVGIGVGVGATALEVGTGVTEGAFDAEGGGAGAVDAQPVATASRRIKTARFNEEVQVRGSSDALLDSRLP